jgi:hypothetical protein
MCRVRPDTGAQRSLYSAARGFSPVVIGELQEMRLTSPSRPVSQRGWKNVLVDMTSECNQGRRRLESLTCEFIFALELDTFDCCREYYTQVFPKNVVRNRKTSAAHVDFLVLRKDRVELVECKPQSGLEDLAKKQPDEWLYQDGKWRQPVLEAWARERGLIYTIWSPPNPHGIYGANMLAVYAAKSADPSLADVTSVGPLTPMFVQGAQTWVSCPPGHDTKVCALLEAKVCEVWNAHVHTLLARRQQSMCRLIKNNRLEFGDSRLDEAFDNQSMC